MEIAVKLVGGLGAYPYPQLVQGQRPCEKYKRLIAPIN
jgi:hypothetical protein